MWSSIQGVLKHVWILNKNLENLPNRDQGLDDDTY